MSYTTAYGDPELYDLVYSWYDADIAYYVAAARAAAGPVLEIACGSGRVLIPCLEAGADADGLDLDAGMLEHLRAKAGARGLTPRLVQGDMRDFTMPRRYALVIIPFRSFMHLETSDDQIRALRCIRDHLEPGGALVFNVFHPHFETLVNPAGSVHTADRTLTHPGTGLPVLLRVVENVPDRVNQLLHVTREVVFSDAGGRVTGTSRHAFTLRWVYKAEMELLLRAAGYTRFEVRGGFAGEPLERDDQEMVWTAWKD